MLRGLWRMGIGLTFIVCGLNGELVLKGTDSGGALAVLGVLLLGWGVFGTVSVLRAESDESARSKRALYRNARGTRTPPSWMSTRRRR
jgi:hypothetical protein